MTAPQTDGPQGQRSDDWIDTGTDRVDELQQFVEDLRGEGEVSPERFRRIDRLLSSLKTDLHAAAQVEGIDLEDSHE